MDDAVKLREIARRIREGARALSAASGDVPVTPAPASTAVGRSRDESRNEPDRPPPPGDPVTAAALADSSDAVRSEPGTVTAETIAKLAHELKTPLSAIAAASEVMKDERFGSIANERYRGYVADIHAGAQHALLLIERLLTQGGDVTAEPREAMSFAALDVNVLAASCLSSQQPLADKARLKLAGDLAPGLAPLTADATSLRQILLNLLANAIKFARPGDEVRVTTRKDASGGGIVIEVRDTGPGMSRAEIARALSSLGTPDLANKRPGGGLGLGLPLVRSLVEANAGRLKIDSAPGKGTTVTLTFPRNRLIAI
jgi:signal transduction histidine kinase